jgi:DNA-binding transcriptional regulator YdaS (Cro superfamily)
MISIPAPERVIIAGKVGLNEQYLYQCFTGRRELAAERCVDVERASGGAVCVESLRPDVRWVRLPDTNWPHPCGRPCVDIAGERLAA